MKKVISGALAAAIITSNLPLRVELLPSEWTSEINKFTLNLEGSNFYA